MWLEKGACDSRHVPDQVLAEHFDGNAAVKFWTGPGQPEPGQSRIANRRQHLADTHGWSTVDELGEREDMFATALAQRHDFAPPLPAMQRRARDAEFLLQIGRPGNLTGPVFDEHRLEVGGAIGNVSGYRLPIRRCGAFTGAVRRSRIAAGDPFRHHAEELGAERGHVASERADREPLRVWQERKGGSNAPGNHAGGNKRFCVQ